MQRKQEDALDTSHENETKTKVSRRKMLFGIAAAAVGAAVLWKPKKALATPEEASILAEISSWMKTTYATSIAPTVNTIQAAYTDLKGWIQTWNDFVSNFNTVMRYSEEVKNFLTQKTDNWFYQTYIQTKDYVNNIFKADGNILSYRLQYYDPILIKKIDSFMDSATYLIKKGQRLVKSYSKIGVDMKGSDTSDLLRSTNEGKVIIRSSIDQAKYLDSQARVLALKQTIDSINKKMTDISAKDTSPNSTAEIYSALISPVNSQLLLLQCSLLSEIYQKLNDIFAIGTKEAPTVGKDEKIVTEADMKKFMNSMGTARDMSKVEGFIL